MSDNSIPDINKDMRTDCTLFNGYKPCKYHKLDRRSCAACEAYKPVGKRILIIKLEAAGEVLRSTPFISRIKELHADAEITLITKYPQLINRSLVDRLLHFDFSTCMSLLIETFDIVFSLDKSHEACALAQLVKTKTIKGFILSALGKIIPSDADAYNKWFKGVDDNLMMSNKMHYVEELFDACGLKWHGEEYILPDFPQSPPFSVPESFTVGIQTGAGDNWKTRVLSDHFLCNLIDRLKRINNVNILLLGGPTEHERNKLIAINKDVLYHGTFNYPQFISVVNLCNVVVTPVTFALHVSIGLKKNIVLLNNIFNKYEFYLYNLGAVIEPDITCLGCYKTNFDAHCPVKDCTELYDIDTIARYIIKWKNLYDNETKPERSQQ